jgi:DNA-binding CsgD family transcriptional regulator
MFNKPRSPLTDAERQEIRDRASKGESYLDIARAFLCSPRTVEKICVGLRARVSGVGVPITTRQIEQIAQLRGEGLHIPQIARMVGVSITSVTRYSPREMKRASSVMGGTATSDRKKEKWQKREEFVSAMYAALPPPKPKPVEELPETVLRMTESFRMRGMSPENARAEAIRIYAKTKR